MVFFSLHWAACAIFLFARKSKDRLEFSSVNNNKTGMKWQVEKYHNSSICLLNKQRMNHA